MTAPRLKPAPVWTVRKIADYWRLQRDGYLIATFNTKGAALAGMAVEKRRYAAKDEVPPMPLAIPASYTPDAGERMPRKLRKAI